MKWVLATINDSPDGFELRAVEYDDNVAVLIQNLESRKISAFQPSVIMLTTQYQESQLG